MPDEYTALPDPAGLGTVRGMPRRPVSPASEPVAGLTAPPVTDGSFPATARTRVRRADRASYDRALVHAILDEAPLCHVAFVIDGTPFVVPMLHGRVEDTLYLHGLPASRIMRHLRAGAEVCVAATLVDGWVMARSSFHHSVNYRSAVVLGPGRLVRSRREKLDGLRAIVEHLAPGRWADARPPSEPELRQTQVVAIPIREASAKVRTGPPADDPGDLVLPVWAGVIPVHTTFGAPAADTSGERAPIPAYLAALIAGPSADPPR